MRPIPNDLDWSATAAWIALAISITGTIAGPIITTILTNRHQLKLRKLDIQEKAVLAKISIIQKCISNIGACLADESNDSLRSFGEHFHVVYSYVSSEHWALLDDFYQLITNNNYDAAKKLQPDVIHLLTGLLKEELPKHP